MYQGFIEYIYRLRDFGIVSVLVELLIIGTFVYFILKFLEGTRGLRLLRGLVWILAIIFLVLGVLAENLHLVRLKVLAKPALYMVFFGSLVVFQPELRRALMRVGEVSWLREWISESQSTIDAIVSSVKYLSAHKIGALIAIERQVGLASVIERGVRLDAAVTSELIKTIFWPGSSLHDLGLIIQEDRIAAASCEFPATNSDDIDSSLGSRHRAAVGLTEDSDAVVIVVSEETGMISIAREGKLFRGLTIEALKTELNKLLITEKTKKNKRKAKS